MLKLVKYLIPTLLVLSFSSFAETADELIAKAQQSFSQKKYSSSLIYLKNAAKNEPRNLQVHLELIKVFIFTGQGIQAKTEVDKAIRLNATAEQIVILQAKTQYLLGEYDEITNGFNFVDLPQKDIARIRAIQGHAFYEKRQFKQARLMFQRAYLLSPQSLEVQLGQSLLYKIDGNTEQEKKLVESLQHQYPNEPSVMLRAGEYYYSIGKFSKALSFFQDAGKIQPSNVNVWFGVVRSYLGQKDYENAKNEIQKVLTNYPEHQVANYLLAIIAFEQQDYSRAKSAIDIVIKGEKRNFEAFKLLGTILFQQQDYSAALKNLQKYLEFNPNDTDAIKTIAAIYLKRKQASLAINILKPLLNRNDPYIFSMMATAYQIEGMTKKSKVFLAKAVKLAPNNKVIQKQYKRTQLQSGQSIKFKFTDNEYNNFLGQGHLHVLNLIRNQQYDKATNVLNRYLKKSPKSALLYYLLGTTSLYKNDTKQAKIEFKKSIKLNDDLIESKINLAKILSSENNDRDAERLYREVLKTKPQNDQALVSLAGIFHRRGKDDEMLQWLNKSRKINNASLASREVLVDYYKRKKNFAKAQEISKEMVRIQPENISLLVKHAENLRLNKRPDLSVQVYKKIVALKPNAAASWFGLGKMQSLDNNLEQSYKSFEKALTLAPKSLVIRILLTKFDLQKNDNKKALSRAKELVKIHPNKSPSYEVLGDVYIAFKKYKDAIKSYNKAVKLNFNTETYIKLFSAYNLNKQPDFGLKQLISWVKKFPKDLNLKEILALTYQRQEKYKLAQNLYEEIIKVNSKSDRVFNNLALVTLKQNSPMSMEYADIAYNLNSKNALNLDTLGWVHFKHNNTNEAIEYLSRAVKLAPENPDFRYHFAVALNKSERIREARTQLALIIETEGTFINRDKAKALFKKLNNKGNN